MATKKAAESTLYHLSPKGFWKKFREVAAVNPEISSGLPLASLHRYPPPASRPEQYSTPATKASDLAQNPYWKRDVRRAYPQLSVVTQAELSNLLIQHSSAQAINAPSDAKDAVPAVQSQPKDLSEAISTVTSTAQVYSESKLPPSLPTPFKRWQPALSPAAPHDLMSQPPPSPLADSSADVQRAAFADDPRIYFSKTTNTWRFEQDNGEELEYDNAKGAWIPVVDDETISRQQAAYSVSGVDESVPAAPVLKRENKKRKVEDYTSATSSEPTTIKRGKTDKKDKPPTERKSKNTAIYITGLPLDTELDELIDRFSKCGVIEEDEEGEPKVKMYAREDGTFNGEALVVYFKEDSVTLAVNLLDDAELRLGQPSSVMKVVKADFAHKQQGGSGSDKPRKTVDKKKITKRIGKMQRKLEEWGDDDGFGPQPDPEANAREHPKVSRVVVLKHMFRLEDLEQDASLLLDLKEDVRDECSSLGEKEPEGIMTVKFKDLVSAQACVLKMNGRFFDGRRVEAELFTGRQRFKRSGASDAITNDAEDDERKRLDDFADWLMKEGE
ncbi:hypothetical protein CVT24_003937 [Panaeolus cyanescens]|uniref:RRM domain-containing protein n=1 Tax=Panaeolus cyanescens TaxID=181874 RepID=A0A409Y6F6_9AGAR|nr:hypothetical protein CVT24_003937 [Panaeolus cyanescens]